MSDRPFNPHCLHCMIIKTVEEFFVEHGRRDAHGNVLLDVSEAVAKLSDATAELVFQANNRAQRRQYQRYARECLEAGFKFQQTGRPQVVYTGDQEPETRH